MPTRELPENPDLEQLKKQAKALQRAVRAGEPPALELLAELHPRADSLDRSGLTSFSRGDALLVTARLYRFSSWTKLRAHVERVGAYSRHPYRDAANADAGDEDEFLRMACLTYGADDVSRRDRARALLASRPQLAVASIHAMAAVGDVAAATRLLDADSGQARREGGPHGWEPLLYAAYSRIDSTQPGHSTLDVARLLLANGADPDAGYLSNGLYPFTALTGAFGEGEAGPVHQPRHQHSAALARLLLHAGADPNDSQALYNRQFEASDDHLELLFEYGLGTGSGGPWHERFAANHPSPAEMLRDQLQWATEDNRVQRVRLLLAHGVDPEGPDPEDGPSAYALALRAGNSEIAELLAAAGARPVTLDPVQTLAAAIMSGDRAAVERLTRSDPTLTARLISEEPGLILRAAALGRQDAVTLMVSLGLDVNLRRRTTPLHEAAGAGDLAMVKLLIELGADPTTYDTAHHSTPLGWASHGRHQPVVDYLTDRAG